MKYPTICILIALGGSLASAETKVKLTDLPPAVQRAVQRETKDTTLVGISKERERGRTVYEVETKGNGKGRDLMFAADGSLLEIEEEVDLNSIPAPARQAIEKQTAGETVKKIESVTHGSMTSYEAQVKTKTRHSREIAVNADGSPHREN
jgi:uncharacterized membrane protein YkoI